jgi:hypothetical protein
MKEIGAIHVHVDGLQNDMLDLGNQVGDLVNCVSGVENHLAGVENRITGIKNDMKAVLACESVLSIFFIYSNVFATSIDVLVNNPSGLRLGEIDTGCNFMFYIIINLSHN